MHVERVGLSIVAGVGLLGLNGVFVDCLLFRREAIAEALDNPVALAFTFEALLVMALLAYAFGKWRVSRLGRTWFVLLSLVGGLAFSIPLALLLAHRRDPSV